MRIHANAASPLVIGMIEAGDHIAARTMADQGRYPAGGIVSVGRLDPVPNGLLRQPSGRVVLISDYVDGIPIGQGLDASGGIVNIFQGKTQMIDAGVSTAGPVIGELQPLTERVVDTDDPVMFISDELRDAGRILYLDQVAALVIPVFYLHPVLVDLSRKPARFIVGIAGGIPSAIGPGEDIALLVIGPEVLCTVRVEYVDRIPAFVISVTVTVPLGIDDTTQPMEVPGISGSCGMAHLIGHLDEVPIVVIHISL